MLKAAGEAGVDSIVLFSDGVTIEMSCDIGALLHQPASHPIYSYGVD